jgi:hypothetical protein
VRRDAPRKTDDAHVALTARGVALAERSFVAMMAAQSRLLRPLGKRRRNEIGLRSTACWRRSRRAPG